MDETDREFRARMERRNAAQLPLVLAAPVEDRVLFIARCVRRQNIAEISDYARGLGYRVFVIESSDMLRHRMAAEKPAAVVGIACRKELSLVEEVVHVPYLVILLDRCSCEEVDFDMDEAKELLSRAGADSTA